MITRKIHEPLSTCFLNSLITINITFLHNHPHVLCKLHHYMILQLYQKKCVDCAEIVNVFLAKNVLPYIVTHSLKPKQVTEGNVCKDSDDWTMDTLQYYLCSMTISRSLSLLDPAISSIWKASFTHFSEQNVCADRCKVEEFVH